MKWVAYNVPFMCFLATAAYLFHLDHPIAGGWCIAGALFSGIVPGKKDE